MNKTIEKYYSFFTTTKRASNEEEIVILKDNAPEELREAVRDAHGDRLPDDWVYQTFNAILEHLEGYTIDDIDDLEEYRGEIIDGMIDIYNKDLIDWLDSSCYNADAVNNAKREYGTSEDGDIYDDIKRGQYYAIDEIYGHVVSLLDNNNDNEN